MTRTIAFDDRSRQQTHFTTCYMCACRCGIKVTVEGDKVRFIQGNLNHPVNKGVLCAKGSAGIMKQYSAAKLRKPLKRRPGSERGDGDFVEIEWDEALDIARRARLREDPRRPIRRKLAFFTGRDQMQALSGLWAQQFGTPNWAAHGGFCSVNMAVAGLYTIGYSFWEFGAPDWDHAKYFVLWGVAEDHSSNPIKIGLDKLKRRGAKFVSINPVRTGYSAIADEWLPIRPGTDGLLALSIVHVLLKRGTDRLGIPDPLHQRAVAGRADAGHRRATDCSRATRTTTRWCGTRSRSAWPTVMLPDIAPALFATRHAPRRSPRRRRCFARHRALSRRSLCAGDASPRNAASPPRRSPASRTRWRTSRSTRRSSCRSRWTDMHGRTHDKVVGRPVAMYAMRGISAHSNGFQTCRALHLIQMLLGALDGPGNFRARAPYPRRIPMRTLPENDPAVIFAPDTPLKRMPNGNPTRPEDLVIDKDGKPLRIDKAYSWEIAAVARTA